MVFYSTPIEIVVYIFLPVAFVLNETPLKDVMRFKKKVTAICLLLYPWAFVDKETIDWLYYHFIQCDAIGWEQFEKLTLFESYNF